MITWVTVWVLTITYITGNMDESATYQLHYATQNICEKQRKNHQGSYKRTRCDFQQVPVYTGVKK